MSDSDARAPSERQHPDADSPQSSGSVRSIYFWFAPALLAVVAISQLIMGTQFNLTPWKGGGFGMFSTVDGPSGRTVRVYLETDAEEIPTDLPKWVGRRKDFTRSFPHDTRLSRLAHYLAAGSWHYIPPKGKRKEENSDASANDDDSKIADDGDSATDNDDDDAFGDDPPSRNEKANAKPAKDKKTSPPYPPVSSRSPGVAPRSDRVPVEVRAIRLEVWGRVYDPVDNRLSLRKINEARAVVGQ